MNTPSKTTLTSLTLLLALSANTPILGAADPPANTAIQPYSSTAQDTTLTSDAARKLGYQTRWTTDLYIPSDHHLAQLQILGGLTVCIEAPSNLVTALSTRDGSTLWQKAVGNPSDRLFAPARHENTILINSETTLYILAADNGESLRSFHLESLVISHALPLENHAVFATANRKITAVNLATGLRSWAYQMPDTILTEPALIGRSALVTDAAGNYALLSIPQGQLEWKGRTFGRISAPPAANPTTLFIASEDYSLYALNLATGKDRWVYRTTQRLTQPPNIIDNTACLLIPQKGLVGIDASSGQEKWAIPDALQLVAKTLDHLLIQTANGFALVDPDTGQRSTEVNAPPLAKILTGPDDSLILASKQGRITRIDNQP
jgi:outer membrane protein assembly factor BamB